MSEIEIKLGYVTGLSSIVKNELKKYPELKYIREEADNLYLDFFTNWPILKKLNSVARVYLIKRNPKYHPLYISNYKSILGELIELVVNENKKDFKTFNISCAGADSPEVKSIEHYLETTYGLINNSEADLKIHIVKLNDTWEIGLQTTPRPLSVRNYRVKNMSGAMDSTIAYALNSLCDLNLKKSYLNIFSGSGTLLIEAGLNYPNLEQLIGFDNNKEHLTISIQNIKQAGQIKRIQVKEKDIFDKPNFGKFEVITSDLPFGMAIAKNENLEKLYQEFIQYCQTTLTPGGILAVYTSEFELLEKILNSSDFKISQSLELELVTSINSYLKAKIFVCKFK